MLQTMSSHRSVRKYTAKPISDEEFYELIRTAQHAASSNFVQAYSVIQVKDTEKIQRLGKLSKNEKQFKTSALSLLFCADLKRAEYAVRQHGQRIKGGTLENFVVAVIDTALFAQNFVIAAESKGYGICFIGGVRNNPEKISELFNLPNYVIPLFGMTVGKPAENNEVKPRLPVEAIIHEDEYDADKYGKYLRLYDDIMKDYYNTRMNNPKDSTWSRTMVDFLTEKRRVFLKDFVLSKGFLKSEQ